MINTDKKTTASNEKLISKKRVPMIISLLIIIASLLVIIISIHFKKQDSCLVDNDTEKYLNPSEETMEIAKTAVEKLQLGVVFMPGVIMKTLSELYNDTAKWVAPELLTLETKEDAAIALIKIYEEMLEEYRSCDLDWFYDNVSSGQQPEKELLSEHNKIVRLQRIRMSIEALLALDCYYNLLDAYGIQRMTNDFNDYLTIDNSFASKYFDSFSTETMFKSYRNGDFFKFIVP